MQPILKSMFLVIDKKTVLMNQKTDHGSRIKNLEPNVVHESSYFFTDRIGYGSRFDGHGRTRIKKNLDPHTSRYCAYLRY